MFNINSWEMLLLVALFVILFGPDRLPTVIGQVVKLVRDLQQVSESATAELRRELEAATRAADLKSTPKPTPKPKPTSRPVASQATSAKAIDAGDETRDDETAGSETLDDETAGGETLGDETAGAEPAGNETAGGGPNLAASPSIFRRTAAGPDQTDDASAEDTT